MGVLNSGDVDAPEKEDGLVFYQFGNREGGEVEKQVIPDCVNHFPF
jgi:hypothetical protein